MTMAKMTLDELRSSVRGQTIGKSDSGYDTARRVYNAMIDRHPQVIVRGADGADVMAAVTLARDEGLPISVRGGSHSVPGFGTNDGGVVIDLGAMQGVRVDPEARTAWAEGGC